MVDYKIISNKTLRGTRMKVKGGGRLIASYNSCIDNPCWAGTQIELITNPQLTIKNGYGLFQSSNKGNKIYRLARDNRQPKVCPCCTPVPEHPENGINLGGDWLFTTKQNETALFNYNTGHMNHYLILFAPTDPKDALKYTLETHVKKINSTQSKMEKQITHFCRAPEITPAQINTALDFIIRDLVVGEKGMPLEKVWPEIRREEKLSRELSKKSREMGKNERIC